MTRHRLLILIFSLLVLLACSGSRDFAGGFGSETSTGIVLTFASAEKSEEQGLVAYELYPSETVPTTGHFPPPIVSDTISLDETDTVAVESGMYTVLSHYIGKDHGAISQRIVVLSEQLSDVDDTLRENGVVNLLFSQSLSRNDVMVYIKGTNIGAMLSDAVDISDDKYMLTLSAVPAGIYDSLTIMEIGAASDGKAIISMLTVTSGDTLTFTIEDTIITDTTISDTVISDTTISDTVISDTSISDTVISDTTISDTILVDTTFVDTTISNTTVGDTVVIDTTVSDTNIVDSIFTDTTIVDTSIVDSTIIDSTIVDSTIIDTVFNDSVVSDTTVLGSTIRDTVVTDTSMIDTVVTDTTIRDTTVNSSTVSDTVVFSSLPATWPYQTTGNGMVTVTWNYLPETATEIGSRIDTIITSLIPLKYLPQYGDTLIQRVERPDGIAGAVTIQNIPYGDYNLVAVSTLTGMRKAIPVTILNNQNLSVSDTLKAPVQVTVKTSSRLTDLVANTYLEGTELSLSGNTQGEWLFTTVPMGIKTTGMITHANGSAIFGDTVLVDTAVTILIE